MFSRQASWKRRRRTTFRPPDRPDRPADPDAAAKSMTPGATWNTPVVLSFALQGSAQAICSARSLIPRSIFWLITKLTASTGSTRNRAHGRV